MLLSGRYPVSTKGPVDRQDPCSVVALPEPVTDEGDRHHLRRVDHEGEAHLNGQFGFRVLRGAHSVSLHVLGEPRVTVRRADSASELRSSTLRRAVIRQQSALHRHTYNPYKLTRRNGIHEVTAGRNGVILCPLGTRPLIGGSRVHAEPSVGHFLFRRNVHRGAGRVRPVDGKSRRRTLANRLLSVRLLLANESDLGHSAMGPCRRERPVPVTAKVHAGLKAATTSARNQHPSVRVRAVLDRQDIDIGLPFPTMRLVQTKRQLRQRQHRVANFRRTVPHFDEL